MTTDMSDQQIGKYIFCFISGMLFVSYGGSLA